MAEKIRAPLRERVQALVLVSRPEDLAVAVLELAVVLWAVLELAVELWAVLASVAQLFSSCVH